MRSNYQAYIWRSSLIPKPDIPSPIGHGWKKEGNSLVFDWCDSLPAPISVLSLIICSCQGKCERRQCSCVAHSLHCSEGCRCSEQCMNKLIEQDRDTDDDDDDDEEKDAVDEDD